MPSQSMPGARPESDDQSLCLDLPDLARTAALGRALAGAARPGDCIALHGDLGAGKTELARAFLRAAGVSEDVPSPTFAIVQPYDTDLGPVAHFDLYRIESPSDLDEIGFEAALDDGIVLVEWPERAGPRLPADRLDVTLTLGPEGRRTARLQALGDWLSRLAGLFPDPA
ncbi:tRNA (adenosine(37)-N6)-threonylcarbamoyltransferase complex ATPase subunit type 1 TsaE [Zavarzinia compransoris]|uniref:tRNA (adenosine(37)-N6)-threonylcarbamoyltransferase complex ATPase subunit type 1 TsaE n=1 Tax=Zavarzinia marina TaxID=2911065 RepID=UPI001EEE36D6|nr:tRNA (adenosine(37)-N6)-threonylcarbamoyltransferase complex ATPase subunit type 1 TsaE [Zavarzinia marina]MCF4167652.1 tRNA (adenosine(37)-N6)-threonylcarbamoyltransferase complex ATPase subunit type 1 TsaE [Zavarzinia marina]